MNASDRLAEIYRHHREGNWELAHAMDAERKCPDCGAFICTQGYSVDPERACFYCKP